MPIIILCLFIAGPWAQADDLLNVLDGEATQIDGFSQETKASVFKSLIKRPTAEQNIFFQFLEKGDNKKALYQWASAFDGTTFANTANGRALYGYLLFKNDLQLTGLSTLFTADARKIDKALVDLWRGLMQTNDQLWSLVDVKWGPQWTQMFGVPAEIIVMTRQFEKELSISEIEALLRRTSTNTWERSWTEWRYVTSLLLDGQDVKAAKLLKHLQTIKENNPVSNNLMNITAARMLYQNGYLTQSLRYYDKITKASDYWFEAREEMGWAELRLGQPQNTLAHTQTLLTPAFEPDIGPEPFYLASLAQLKVCDYTEVSKTLAEFRKRFREKAASLLALKEKTSESPAVKKLFTVLKEKRASMPELGGHGVKLPRHSTRDESLYFKVQRHARLEKEAQVAKTLYSQSLSEGTAQVGFQAPMEKFRNMIVNNARESYSSTLNRIKELADIEITEISSVLKKMQIVEAELIQQLALTDRVIEDTKSQKALVKKGTTGSKERFTLSFPFQGEVWFDELDHYKIDIAKGCQAAGKKAL